MNRTKNLFIYVALSMAVIISAASCTQSEQPDTPSMTTAVEEVSFPADGGEYTVYLISENVEVWDAYTTASWVEPVIDKENNGVILRCAITDEIQDRECRLIVYSDFEETIEIPIKQEGNGIVYERSSKAIMNLHGNVHEVSFYFNPMYVWERNPSYLSNLVFDENGMLTHFEYFYREMDGSMVNHQAECTYDDLNRIVRMDVDMGTASFALDFTYSDHDKYIPTDNLFAVCEAWGCYIWNRIWMPKMIKNLASVTLTSEYIEPTSYTTRIDVDGDTGQAVYYAEGVEETLLNSYIFNGEWPSSMEFQKYFVGIYIPAFIDYTLDPSTGNLSAIRHYNDEVYGTFYQQYFNDDRMNTMRYCYDNLETYYDMELTYNDRLDLTYLNDIHHGNILSLDYVYDTQGNWTEVTTNEVTGDDIPVAYESTRTITYYE